MIKYIKMFTLIILVTLLSGCTLENIFNREKPNSNYYTYELSNLISDNSFEIHILDRNVYRNISVTNEDLSILDDLLKNIKDSNYLLETPDDLPSKPIYTLFITTIRLRSLFFFFCKEISRKCIHNSKMIFLI